MSTKGCESLPEPASKPVARIPHAAEGDKSDHCQDHRRQYPQGAADGFHIQQCDERAERAGKQQARQGI
jgi:hypothetical protein